MTPRVFPLLGALLFFVIGVGWRAWVHWRRYGNTGIALFRSGRWGQHVRDVLIFLLFLGLIGQGVVAAAWPALLSYVSPLPRPEAGARLVSGAILLFGGLILLVAAQLRLGKSWRIGIEEGAKPGLVTGGPYRICRNPIFSAMFISLIGYVILLPTWLSIGGLLATFLGVRRQVLQEEDYLLRTYGDDYRIYARRVGRFLPGVGRLR